MVSSTVKSSIQIKDPDLGFGSRIMNVSEPDLGSGMKAFRLQTFFLFLNFYTFALSMPGTGVPLGNDNKCWLACTGSARNIPYFRAFFFKIYDFRGVHKEAVPTAEMPAGFLRWLKDGYEEGEYKSFPKLQVPVLQIKKNCHCL
jgi:hypothetical protein